MLPGQGTQRSHRQDWQHNSGMRGQMGRWMKLGWVDICLSLEDEVKQETDVGEVQEGVRTREEERSTKLEDDSDSETECQTAPSTHLVTSLLIASTKPSPGCQHTSMLQSMTTYILLKFCCATLVPLCDVAQTTGDEQERNVSQGRFVHRILPLAGASLQLEGS